MFNPLLGQAVFKSSLQLIVRSYKHNTDKVMLNCEEQVYPRYLIML